ncbi:MAG: hypothetical protein GKR95_05440 [Gammaproteobacteria bacterium]|nr:hypothetical protein [Gammaproteobacteria bacterium]
MYFHTERYCKVDLIKDTPHDKILIGSSRTAWIDPTHSLGENALNVSFSGATIEEIYVFLQKHLQPDTEVYLGIDFEMLYFEGPEPHQALMEKTDFDKSFVDYTENFLGFEVISKSIAVYFYRVTFIPSIPLGAEGHRVPRPGRMEQELRAQGHLANYNLDSEKPLKLVPESVIEARIGLLEKIKTVLKTRNATYHVFTNPIMPSRLSVYKTHYPELFELVQAHQRELTHVFTKTRDFAMEHPYTDSDFRDWSHYYESIGSHFLSALTTE